MDRSELSSGDRGFLTCFEAGELPRQEWNHESHLRIVWIYLVLQGAEDGSARGLRAVRDYNELCKKTCHHETITRFWIHQAARDLVRSPESSDFASFLAAHPRLGDFELILAYYSRDRLFHETAREGWVEPDLKGLEED